VVERGGQQETCLARRGRMLASGGRGFAGWRGGRARKRGRLFGLGGAAGG